jgi:phosphoribosylanthranilate isomerase
VNTPFRIKICGVTSVADAVAIAASGADALGLNFYAKSPRCIDMATAIEIASAVRGHARAVGLFVNAEAELVRRAAVEVGLDVVQLHGDESPEYVASLGDLVVVKAFRVTAAEGQQVVSYVTKCEQLGTPLAGVLVDAYDLAAYGGTGKTADWNVARELVQRLFPTPVILAGGLTADNVAAAIAEVQPAGVDTASGVESSPGRKDAALCQHFVAAAAAALAVQSKDGFT